jgi:hypothetical protein
LSDKTFTFPDLDFIVRRGDRYVSLTSLNETLRKLEAEDIELTWKMLRDVLLVMAVGKGE